MNYQINLNQIMKNYSLLMLCLLVSSFAFGQIDAKLFQNPDVSKTHITFTYAGDIWVVPKDGGIANRLISPMGQETFPKFSPDGSTIAFSGNYNGNTDVYSISTTGGIPNRITYHGFPERVVDWHPNGKEIIFASRRESGKERFNQFFTIPSNGGIATKMPMEHAENGSLSADGKTIAFTDKSRLTRTWKRYRGGMAADIWVMDLGTNNAEKVAKNIANDELPMINGENIYFMSDRGTSKRFNLWVYNRTDKSVKQLTHYKNFDMHAASMGPEDIVYEAQGKLFIFNLDSNTSKEVKVELVTDQKALMPKTVNASNYIQSGAISPDGNRVVFQARGELFSVPAKDGFIKNLSQTSGAAERFPAWSPNGKMLAYWSDKTGEYQLVIKNLADNTEKTITNFTSGFRYDPQWSPDSKKVVFIDQSMTVQMLMVDTGELVKIDQLLFQYQGGLSNFTVSWDANSQWVAYAKDMPKRSQAIALFNVNNRKTTQVTSGFYNDFSPSFDPDGKYLYFFTNRHFSPNYSSFDNSFIYDNATLLAAVPLTTSTKSPLAEKNDVVKFTEESKPETTDKKKKDKKDKSPKATTKSTKIDLNGFENRIVVLPVKPGSYRNMTAASGKVLYQKGPALVYYDLKEREEVEIIKGIQGYILTANQKKILIVQRGKFAIINLAKGQKAKDFLATQNLSMQLNPKEEWRQIYRDAWRLERDYFYDENMHGLDWQVIYDRYLPLIEDCVTRWDVNFVLGEMIGELNASHSYKGGGDTQGSKRMNVGYLGADFEVENGYYKIKHIVKGANWDVKDRSPLAQPGLKVNEGDYIIAVNGVKIDASKEIYAAFQGLGNKTIELTINNKPSATGARNIVIKTLSNEFRIRHLQWIESKRKRVEEATNGEAGYIFVTSTGIDGQNELVRQFMGQWDKPALVIDERFNNGGQIPDRFIELLNRKPLAYWAVRDGKDWVFPPVGHAGPKVMLVNGWSGSGGDAFPAYFRKAKLGTLIGTRTWGGLIGISGAPALIDGGSVTVPTFRMYDPDTGEWFKEGHGVEPDIEVDEDAGQLAKGVDPQLEKAIEVIKDKLKTEPYKKLSHPPVEKRD